MKESNMHLSENRKFTSMPRLGFHPTTGPPSAKVVQADVSKNTFLSLNL